MPASFRRPPGAPLYDQEFLDSYTEEAACEARESRLEPLRVGDSYRSHCYAHREMSDSQQCWRRCRLKRCRRAGGCRTSVPRCVGVRHNAWPLAYLTRAIDFYYAGLQRDRRGKAQARQATAGE
jgi:hypothetical protein